MQKKKPAFIFFLFFLNSLGNTHVTTGERLSGGTSTRPHPRVRVRAQENAVDPPETPLSLVRMRPREFSLRVTTWMSHQVRLQI